MENFFYYDMFCSDLGDLMEHLDFEEASDIPDDFKVIVFPATKEPMIKLDVDWIMERVPEDRYSEEGDEGERLRDLLIKKLDFDSLKGLIPELYYAGRKSITLTKEDLIEWIS